MHYVEMYQRKISSNFIQNLMRAMNINELAAEERLRELFPVVRASISKSRRVFGGEKSMCRRELNGYGRLELGSR